MLAGNKHLAVFIKNSLLYEQKRILLRQGISQRRKISGRRIRTDPLALIFFRIAAMLQIIGQLLWII